MPPEPPVSGCDPDSGFCTDLKRNIRHNFDPWKGVRRKAEQVYLRADCLCAGAGDSGDASGGGVSQDGHLGRHVLQLAQEVRRLGAIRAEAAEVDRGRE